MPMWKTALPVSFLSLLLSGCATFMGASTDPSEEHASGNTVVAEPETQRVEDRPFPAPTLYSLLVAEVAGQRQQFNVSVANYLDQARQTQDPGVAQRATRIAQYVGADSHALEAASIWVTAAPFDAQAHQAMAQQLMKAGNFQLALKHMESVLELAGASQFDYLIINAQHLPMQQKRDLLEPLQALVQKHPTYAQLWMAQGTLQIQLHEFADALSSFDQALELRENYTAAALSKARVLHKLKRPKEALSWLEDLHDDMPKHKGIGVLRARILIDLQRLSDARAAFQHLHEIFPDDASIQLSLGLLHFELQDYDLAISALSPLILSAQLRDEAYYYLGRIAEEQQDTERALRNYQSVNRGREYLPAQVKISELLLATASLAEVRQHLDRQRADKPSYTSELVLLESEFLSRQKEFNLAYELLDNALLVKPDDIKLLYSRALLAEKLNDIEQLEADLRHILSLKPNNAEAMNALGYTLADRTDRYEEAQQLIQQALELSPDNPAIMDSLGWLHYRLGDLYKALELLEKAFSSFPDHEVAAHLGEVLWQLDRNQEAEDIWRKGLEHDPESEIIERTLKRLNVEL